MAYNNLTSRTDAGAMIPEEVVRSMLPNLQNTSAAMALFRNIPVSRAQQRFPVLTALPIAYFVSGDTGLKQTTELAWDNKYMNIEEIAVILPIPDAVAEDLEFDIWTEARPLVEQAMGRTLDAAIFFGTNKPASWPAAIVTAVAAVTPTDNVYRRGTNNAAAGGIAEDINQAMALVEAGGYVVNGMVADATFKSRLRSARDTTGQKILDIGDSTVEGVRIIYAMPGLWPTGTGAAELFLGDFNQGIIGIRRDITFDMSKEGIIQDNTGAIIYNAYQQDLTLLRVTFRVGWQMANAINYQQPTEAARYPIAILDKP